MSYKETDLTSSFCKYLKQNPKLLKRSCAIEFKVVKGHTLNLKSHMRPHQIPSLLKAKHLSLYFKIPDTLIGNSPFDSFYLTKADAFIAVLFVYKGASKICYFLDINTVLSFQLIKNKISEAECKRFSSFQIKL